MLLFQDVVDLFVFELHSDWSRTVHASTSERDAFPEIDRNRSSKTTLTSRCEWLNVDREYRMHLNQSGAGLEHVLAKRPFITVRKLILRRHHDVVVEPKIMSHYRVPLEVPCLPRPSQSQRFVACLNISRIVIGLPVGRSVCVRDISGLNQHCANDHGRTRRIDNLC